MRLIRKHSIHTRPVSFTKHRTSNVNIETKLFILNVRPMAEIIAFRIPAKNKTRDAIITRILSEC